MHNHRISSFPFCHHLFCLNGMQQIGTKVKQEVIRSFFDILVRVFLDRNLNFKKLVLIIFCTQFSSIA